MPILTQISPEFNPREKMNPLDDHQLLLGSVRAGAAWSPARPQAAQHLDRIYVVIKLMQVMEGLRDISAGVA